MFVAERRESDFDRIRSFFDRLLRQDSPCRLEAEYPLIFGDPNVSVVSIDPQSENFLSGKLLSRFDSKSLAHIFVFEERSVLKAGLATLRRKIEVAPGRFAEFCFVGSVVTDQAYRQQGLQRELFHVLTNACFEAGIDFMALWSNQLDFYQKLGFSLGGLQASWTNKIPMRLSNSDIPVQEMEAKEFSGSSTLYQAFSRKRLAVQRTEAEMEQLLKIPQMKLYTTGSAYALVGKGEDFPFVCHEWAGEPEHVLACIEAAWRRTPELRILSPGVVHSEEESVVIDNLEKNAFENRLEYLALFRCINPEFNIEDLQPEQLKYPFFIWGLDSI